MRIRASPLCIEVCFSITSPLSTFFPPFVMPESLDITLIVLSRVGLASHRA